MWARLPDRPTLIVGGCSQRTSAAPAALAQIVDDPSLELLELGEVDQPQHVDFQRRRFGGWPHRSAQLIAQSWDRGSISPPRDQRAGLRYSTFRRPRGGKWSRAGRAAVLVLAAGAADGLPAGRASHGAWMTGQPREQPVALLLVDPQPGRAGGGGSCAASDSTEAFLRIGQDDRPCRPACRGRRRSPSR